MAALKDAELNWALPANASAADAYDYSTKGVRVFQFKAGVPALLADLAMTVELFAPVAVGPGVGDRAAAANRDFLSKYAHLDMAPVAAGSLAPPPAAEDVRSGDFFGVIRLDGATGGPSSPWPCFHRNMLSFDAERLLPARSPSLATAPSLLPLPSGLDPMLAWAMGSTTGHTTVAMWIDGELYIVESTAASVYWDRDGIQRTPYATWLEMAQAADYNVVCVLRSSPDGLIRFIIFFFGAEFEY